MIYTKNACTRSLVSTLGVFLVPSDNTQIEHDHSTPTPTRHASIGAVCAARQTTYAHFGLRTSAFDPRMHECTKTRKRKIQRNTRGTLLAALCTFYVFDIKFLMLQIYVISRESVHARARGMMMERVRMHEC